MRMSKLKKCLYLINLLERKGALTLKEINDCYEYSSLYEGDEILPRTFARYKDFISETFPCYIDFNQRTGKYELHRHKALYGEDDSLYDYLLSAYHIEGMTELALKHRDKIILTEAPTGVENVQIILEAIDKKRGIECDYYSYNKKSVKQQFDGSFGVNHSDDQKPERILIKVYSTQVEYIKALPIHESQKEIEATDEWSIFEYRIIPCFNFYQQMLWQRERIEILEPQRVRDEMRKIIEDIQKFYK